MSDAGRKVRRYIDELELLVSRVQHALPLMDRDPAIAREQIQEQLDRVLHFGELLAPVEERKP